MFWVFFFAEHLWKGGFWLWMSMGGVNRKKKEKRSWEMHLTKNLNRNLNFLVGKWKSKLPLPHFHWRHVEFPCGSSLAWLIAGVCVIPIWLWKGSPPSQVKGFIPQSFTDPYWSEMNHFCLFSVLTWRTPTQQVPMEKSMLETGKVTGEKLHCCLCHHFNETGVTILVLLK